MAGDVRCAGRKAGDGRRCRRAHRPGERYCAEHLATGSTGGPTGVGEAGTESAGATIYVSLLDSGRGDSRETPLTVQSLGPEIALLRVLIGEHAAEPETVRKLVAILVRAVQVERGLQQAEVAELSGQVQAFLASLELLPGGSVS